MTIENTRIGGRLAVDHRSAGRDTVGGSDRPRLCCVPPALPADSPVKRRVDRLLPRSGLPVVAYFAAVVGLMGAAQALPAPGYLVVDAVAFLGGGSWCALNFWRSRQAHCLLTGSGWLLLAMFTAAEAARGRSLIGGGEQLVFLAVLALGLIFEAIWYLLHNKVAVTTVQKWPASGIVADGQSRDVALDRAGTRV